MSQDAAMDAVQPTDRLEALVTALAHPYTGADQVAMETEALEEVAKFRETLRFFAKMAARDQTRREAETGAAIAAADAPLTALDPLINPPAELRDSLYRITEMIEVPAGRLSSQSAPLDALIQLHAEMQREFHHNRVDMPVSANLDDWLARIAMIIETLR